jgi:hypothetical protein
MLYKIKSKKLQFINILRKPIFINHYVFFYKKYNYNNLNDLFLNQIEHDFIINIYEIKYNELLFLFKKRNIDYNFYFDFFLKKNLHKNYLLYFNFLNLKNTNKYIEEKVLFFYIMINILLSYRDKNYA